MSLWLDATASHARPPAEVAGVDATSYGLFGGRVTADLPRLYLSAGGQLGTAVAGGEGRWFRGDAAVASGAPLGPGALRGSLSGFMLSYLDPFTYDAYGVDLRPGYALSAGDFSFSLRPTLTLGRWQSAGGAGPLTVAGAEFGAEGELGPVTTRLSGSGLGVENGVTAGAFARGGAELGYAMGRWQATAQVQVQSSPLETETGYGVLLTGDLGAWGRLQAYAGRTVRDPLFGTQGTTAFSLGLTVRPVRLSPASPAPVAAVGAARPEGRLVRFTIRAPSADSVALTGDFSGWDPIPMERTRSGWTIERVLPPGLHHFGFLVDGQWAIPADAPGIVEDGWGRENASLVVEP